ncbi:MAG: beta-lactamase family protein [Sandaracinaceae bacterium]|nr:beta-lactamase family protein [Sandaracinaceae bacterium]
MGFLDSYQSLVSRHEAALSLVRVGEEDRSSFPAESVWEDLVKLYETGLHPAIALAVIHRGRVVLNRTIGHLLNHPAGDAVGDVATPDTLFSLFSASKIVSSMVLHSLVEDGSLSLDDRVVEYLPGFGRHGKDAIAIRHLLNHTAGIPDMPEGVDIEAAVAAGGLDVTLLYDLEPKHAPGVNAAYHPMTGWFLLGEIVRQATGKDLREQLQARFLEPLGFEGLSYGVREADLGRVARHAITGLPVPGFMGEIFERTVGATLDHAVDVSNRREFLTGLVPSVNVVGTPLQTARFMQMLLAGGELGGVRVLRPETIQRATTTVTRGQLDSTFGFPMRYGLGPMMGGNRFSLFGLGTRGAYGHLGLSAVVVYADPRRDLAVAFLNTGKTMAAPGMLQWAWCLQRIVIAASLVR